jgi:hypothetical protein
MKNRITDWIVIILIAVFFIITAKAPDYLGGNIGRFITLIFLVLSIILSWKFTLKQNIVIKIIVYIFQFSILFLFSSIVTELFTGIAMDFYFNIIFLVVALFCYYFFLFRNLYKDLKSTN